MNTANRKTTGLVVPIVAVLSAFTLIASCSKEAENAAQAVDEANMDSASRASRWFAVSAGADQTITLPTNSVTLRAAVTAGTARTFKWSQETGATATIASPNSSSTNVTGLTAGEYRFRLQATDSRGRSATDTVHVSVKGTGTANAAPTVSAGTDQSITLPVSTAMLTGTATDRDGTIASWAWSQASGPAATIQSPSSATTAISGLTTAGIYVFTLKVTDNGGATTSASTTVTVKSASSGGATGNYGTLIYSTGYNSTSDIINSSGQQGNGGLSTTVYKDGPGSFRSVPANVSSGIRSEVQYSESLTPLEGAIEYDVMYEKLFQNSGHSLQFHPVTSGGSASPGLWHVDGKFWLVNWKGGSNAYYPTTFTIPTNKWLHMVFEYKIGSAGYMKLTIDGVVVFNKTNIQVGDGSGQYLKVGVNMWQNQESVVYYDNLKIWKK